MDRVRIGRCSICGGNVMAHHGAWYGICPPPPPTCDSCGAVEAASDPVIPMSPRPARAWSPYDNLTFYEMKQEVQTSPWGAMWDAYRGSF